jgi:hypothetical protein
MWRYRTWHPYAKTGARTLPKRFHPPCERSRDRLGLGYYGAEYNAVTLLDEHKIAVPIGYGPMVAAAMKRLPHCRYNDKESALFGRGRFMLSGLELVRYQLKGTLNEPVGLSLSFTSGFLTLNASRDELSSWALAVYGKERFRQDDAFAARRYPYREGETVYIAPFVYRDYLLRNYAETTVVLSFHTDIKCILIDLRLTSNG